MSKLNYYRIINSVGIMNNQEEFCAAGRLWDEIDDRVEKATEQTLESTTRMLSIVEDTKKIGVSTLTELNCQGDRLQNIQRKEEGIAEDVAYIKRLLKSALGCQWCSCEGFFKTNKPTEKSYKTVQHGIVTIQPQTSCLKWSLSDQLNPLKSNSVTEHKIDQNLRTVSLILDDLSNISKDISDELDIQNCLIADMIEHTSKIGNDIQTVNRLSKNLI